MKQNCVYTKEDFEKYEESLKARYEKEMELYTHKVAKEVGQTYEMKKEHVENHIV